MWSVAAYLSLGSSPPPLCTSYTSTGLAVNDVSVRRRLGYNLVRLNYGRRPMLPSWGSRRGPPSPRAWPFSGRGSATITSVSRAHSLASERGTKSPEGVTASGDGADIFELKELMMLCGRGVMHDAIGTCIPKAVVVGGVDGRRELPHGTGTMYGPDGGKPHMKGQGVSYADLVAVDRHISIGITNEGAGQATEREPQAPLQGSNAHKQRRTQCGEADEWGQHAGKPQQKALRQR
eukprot:387095-Pleurochrysis_carterae.AAC.1